MRKATALVCVVLLAVAAAGCSSDSSDGADETTTTVDSKIEVDSKITTTTRSGDVEPTKVTAKEYTAALITGMTTGKAEQGDLVLTQDAADCVAPKFVEIMTVKRMNEAGLTAEDLTDPGFDATGLGLDEDEGAELVAAFGDCDFDIYGELASALTQGLPEEQQQCAAENIDHDQADAMLAKTFSTGSNDAEFEALINSLTEACDLPAN